MADEQPGPALPAGLAVLFGDGGAGRTLPVALPPGRLVRPALEQLNLGPKATTVARPAYWLSEQPATAELWRRLHAEHARSGLWPLLLQGFSDRPQRPWVVGEVDPEPAGDIDRYDAAGFLATMWTNWVELVERAAAEGGVACDFHHVAPFGRAWPGLAPAGELLEDPGVVAAWYAGLLADGTPRLGLVAADRSADALAVTGWLGACNYVERTAPLAAVVRSWEDRFGVRVVGIGFDTLHLSVAAPPATPEHALQVAAEHFAFCPDNIVADLIGLGPTRLLPMPSSCVASSPGRFGGTDTSSSTARSFTTLHGHQVLVRELRDPTGRLTGNRPRSSHQSAPEKPGTPGRW